MMSRIGQILVVSSLVLAGCTTAVESQPPRTATEEMLISTAADRAADKLAIQMPPGTKVFIDGTNFEGTDAKYAMGAIRTALLKQGVRLVDAKKDAKIVVEARSGALSMDKETTLFGIPSFNVPVPFASGAATFPEIAFYSSEEQKGVAKFAITSIDTDTGTMVDMQDPQYGFAHKTKQTVLIFVTWSSTDAVPKSDADPLTRQVDAKPVTNSNLNQ